MRRPDASSTATVEYPDMERSMPIVLSALLSTFDFSESMSVASDCASVNFNSTRYVVPPCVTEPSI